MSDVTIRVESPVKRLSMSQLNSVGAFALRNPILQLAGVMLLATFLMLLFLGDKSIWVDEGYSIERASDWASILDIITLPVLNMSLYYVLLHIWIGLFGDGEFAVRSLSVVFGLATLPVAFALISRLFDSRVGLMAVVFLTLNAYFIQYAQEARTYSLLMLLATLSSYFLVRSLADPSWKNWAGYIFVTALLPYAHFLGGLMIIAHALSLAFFSRTTLPWKSLIVSGLVICLMWLPSYYWLITFQLYEMGVPLYKIGISPWTEAPGGTWIRETKFPGAVSGVFYYLTGRGGWALTFLYFILGLVGTLQAIRTWRQFKGSHEAWRYALLLSWIFVPIFLIFVISIFRPLVVMRYFLLSLPPLAFFAAVGLCQIRNRWVFGVLLAILVLLAGRGVYNWYMDDLKADWRSTARYIVSNASDQDAILFNKSVIVPFIYYSEKHVPVRAITASTEEDQSWRLPRLVIEKNDSLEDIAKLNLGQYERLWVLTQWYSDRFVEQQDILAYLQREFAVTQNKSFKGIKVVLYEKLPEPGVWDSRNGHSTN